MRTDVGLIWRLLVLPYAATQENLDRNPYYRLFHGAGIKARVRARLDKGAKPGMTISDVIILVVWWLVGIPFVAVMALIFQVSVQEVLELYESLVIQYVVSRF